VEPFISGVTAVEGNKILRSRNIRAGGTVNSDSDRIGLCAPGPSGVIFWPSLPLLALRTAVRSIIRRTPPFEVKKWYDT